MTTSRCDLCGEAQVTKHDPVYRHTDLGGNYHSQCADDERGKRNGEN